MNSKAKTVLVTGASGGIGRETAIVFSRSGYFVFLIGRNTKKLNETQQLLGGQEKSKVIQADLSQINGINSLIGEIKTQTKTLDVVLNIAGIWHNDNEVFADKDYQDFNQQVVLDTLSVGIIAPMLIVHGLLPIMNSRSKVINLSGTFENGGKGWLPYYVSKKAIEDFTVGLSEELEKTGIKVNGVSPSDVATDAYKNYFPEYVDESLDPKQVAQFMFDLCEDKFISKNGEIFVLKKDKNPFKSFHA